MTPSLPNQNEFVSLINAGRPEDLERRAREAIALDPLLGIAWKALSVALRMQGKAGLDALQQAAAALPDDAESHVNLGNALLEANRAAEAATSYQRALDLNPTLADAHCNLGSALRALGRMNAAETSYRAAIGLQPTMAVAHANLGNSLRAEGRLDEAVASYRRALILDPVSAKTYNNLGNTLLDLGLRDEAIEQYRRALTISPQFVEAHSNLGNALRAAGHFDDAVASYRRAIDLRPEFAAAHANMSDALLDLGMPQEAVDSSRRALALQPRVGAAHNSLGNALMDLGDLKAAAASYERAIALEPGFSGVHINHARVLRLLGRGADAQVCCLTALQLDPGAAAALVLLAELQTDGGEFTAAQALFERAVAVDPKLPEACAALAHVRKMTPLDAPWLERALRLAGGGLPPRQEVHLRYAIGKYFDDVGDYPAAFDNFRRANELTRIYAPPYDRQAMSSEVDRLISVYDAQWAGRLPAAGSGISGPTGRSVFIVGMPRSGTTLAEQILASHAAVFGAGELPFWVNTAARCDAPPHDAARRAAVAAIVADAANRYVDLLHTLSPQALRLVDKMPSNFLRLGLIREALPGARIIHMRRNPQDTCLSIYFQHFKAGHPYANDFGDLAHFHAEYLRLMQHWRVTLPPAALLEVPYAGLVDETETWSRRLVDFIGLPWDARCVDFHATRRNVMTASKWQVRQKISRTSLDRWRNYEAYLGPVRGLTDPP